MIAHEKMIYFPIIFLKNSLFLCAVILPFTALLSHLEDRVF